MWRTCFTVCVLLADEEVNIRSNLPLWEPIIDYFIFMVDKRTQDKTVDAIKDILNNKKPFKIIPNEFDGFGPSRTRSLEAAWEYFPQATHVWIADPDWRPEVKTIRKSDLNLEADAFRFLIYDRNGVSTRRCDWLLRHRKGLAMRYHLHEVLHIGERYTWKVIDWVLHEVEQSGSWHTTVGHGHSMSAQRYLFDLSLLEKDLALYGHDPHTHYYLGVTHEAYAEKYLKHVGSYDDSVEHHVSESIKYLTLRSEASYDDEFPEERWASMYMLGNNDFLHAEHWYNLCHEFSPKQPECMYGLGRLSLSFGLLQKTFDAMKKLVTMEYEERSMLNHFREWSCNIPSFAVEVLLHVSRLLPDEFALHDIKYIEMVKHEQCSKGNINIPDGAEAAVERLARLKSIELPQHQVQEKLCQDSALRQHIKDMKYTLHPCEDLKRETARDQFCRPFTENHSPPPYEGYQIPSFGEYIGAAVVPDIVHHVFGGDASAVLAGKERSTFRILFAEHFSANNVFNLVSAMSKNEFNVEITVLTTPTTIRRIREVFTVCNLRLAARVTFAVLKEHKTYAESLGEQQVANGYDYIEYNGGASRSENYVSELKDLRNLLSSRGSIGATFFSMNNHFDVIRRALSNVNSSSHPPFSVEPERLTKHLLTSRGLSRYTSDTSLISFLSNTTQRGFSREDIFDLITSLDMKILSWLPSAYSHPYDELPHHSVQMFRSHGMSEKDVVEGVIGGFRYTVYVSRRDAQLSGRRKLTSTIIASDTSFIVVDRVGYLGGTFANGPQYAVSSQTISLDLCPFENNRTIFTLAAHPQVLACFSKLSSGVTIGELININAQVLGSAYMEATSKQMLLRSLQYFEVQNMITLWKQPIDVIQRANETKTDKFANTGLKFGKKKTQGKIRNSAHAGASIDTSQSVKPANYDNTEFLGDFYVSTTKPVEYKEEAAKPTHVDANKNARKIRFDELLEMGFEISMIDHILLQEGYALDDADVTPQVSRRSAICDIEGVDAGDLCF